MSLIVAQTTENGPRIVSDTRVSLLDGAKSSFKTGTLKIIIINREIAVCFAGDVEIALSGVRSFAQRLQKDVQTVHLPQELAALTLNQYRPVEFIIANSNKEAKLTRIRDGKIESGLNFAWIGDKNGFEHFQIAKHLYLEQAPSWFASLEPSEKQMLMLDHAMNKVIEDPSINSVDDFCVRVAAKNGEFNYLESSFIHVGRDIRIQSGDNLIAKMVHPIEEGGYAVSIVEPRDAGTPALGLNFPEAKIGMLYLPLLYDEAQVIHDVLPNDFPKVIFEKYGIAMKAPMLRYMNTTHLIT